MDRPIVTIMAFGKTGRLHNAVQSESNEKTGRPGSSLELGKQFRSKTTSAPGIYPVGSSSFIPSISTARPIAPASK